MAPASQDLRLPRRRRLITRRDFRLVYRRGRRAHGAHMVVVGLPRRDAPAESRLGLSVSRANGNAVRRGRIKRLFREAFRLERPGFARTLDLIMIPQAGEHGDYPLDEVRQELARLVDQIARGQNHKASRPRKPR